MTARLTPGLRLFIPVICIELNQLLDKDGDDKIIHRGKLLCDQYNCGKLLCDQCNCGKLLCNQDNFVQRDKCRTYTSNAKNKMKNNFQLF